MLFKRFLSKEEFKKRNLSFTESGLEDFFADKRKRDVL
jgi:hypothetical protein